MVKSSALQLHKPVSVRDEGSIPYHDIAWQKEAVVGIYVLGIWKT